MKALTLLPHKTQSKIEGKHSANPGPGLSRGVQGASRAEGGPGMLGAIRAKNTKKLENARMRGGVQRFMASLLRSNNQDFE